MQKYMRLANKNDIKNIMSIIDEAKQFLKESGSTQWQNGYPNEETIQTDLKNNVGYVFVVGDQVAAYAAVIDGIDPNYNEINGSWKNEKDEYSTIHRICFSSNYQGHGLAKLFISNILTLKYAKGIRNLRVDTHKLNVPMQTLAQHNGFEYRGIIRVDDEPADPDRLAYELNL